jgi:hypothetical protein
MLAYSSLGQTETDVLTFQEWFFTTRGIFNGKYIPGLTRLAGLACMYVDLLWTSTCVKLLTSFEACECSRVMSNPCQYVPLSKYYWKPGSALPWPTCPSALPWNPVIYTLLTAFQACTFCIGLELTAQVFVRFRKKKPFYFWYS